MPKTDPGSNKSSGSGPDKRARILAAAVDRFARHGYEDTRVEDVARDVGVAKGTVFQYFGSKGALLLAAYRESISALPRWLDAPRELLDRGFFEVMEYWLRRTEHLIKNDWVPYRVTLLGNWGVDMALRREINSWLVSEDPYGTLEFVEFGVSRGDLRDDIDPEMMASMIDWLADRFQDALITRELDPGLFRRGSTDGDRTEQRITEFMSVLRFGIDARGPARPRA